MNTLQIDALLYTDKICAKQYAGTLPVDHLPTATIARKPWCCCVNLSPSPFPGSHWVGIYIDTNGAGEFFCSYGNKPSHYDIDSLNEFILRNNVTMYNHVPLQSIMSNVCGEYVVCFLMCRCRGYDMWNFLSCFWSDTAVNDTIVARFVRSFNDA